ncbi:MAG: hypothetical protein JWP25_7375 [Bradyrhizobium sp.]|nr:hypothetical protein [Bradyrhizobium sp.]
MRENKPIISNPPSTSSSTPAAPIRENNSTFSKGAPCGKFQELGNAILKQQQAGDETKQAESDRLKSGKGLVHVISPV